MPAIHRPVHISVGGVHILAPDAAVVLRRRVARRRAPGGRPVEEVDRDGLAVGDARRALNARQVLLRALHAQGAADGGGRGGEEEEEGGGGKEC